MTERSNEFPGFAPERDPPDAERSRLATISFVVGLLVVAVNSALYFFGVDALSHPAVSVVGLALLLPLYVRER